MKSRRNGLTVLNGDSRSAILSSSHQLSGLPRSSRRHSKCPTLSILSKMKRWTSGGIMGSMFLTSRCTPKNTHVDLCSSETTLIQEALPALQALAERVGFEPTVRDFGQQHKNVCSIQPLSHLSNCSFHVLGKSRDYAVDNPL